MFFILQPSKLHIHLMLPIVLATATGIWWQTSTHSFIPILAIAIISLIPILSTRTNKIKILQITIMLSAFFIGTTTYLLQKNKQLNNQNKICKTKCSIKGIVSSIDPSNQKFLKKIVTINIYSFKKNNTKNSWQPINCSIQIYTHKTGILLVGDDIEVENIFLKKPTNESFNLYLIKKNITTTIFEEKINYKLINHPYISLKRFLFYKKKKLYEQLKRKISPTTFSLLSSVFLGNKSKKTFLVEKSKNQFKSWGILHFLARSGLHLIIFILLWNFILSFIPLPFTYIQLILIFISLIYFCLSWTSVSFMRALSIFFLYKLSPLLNKRTNFIHLLSIVCFFMLLFNPVQLLFLDFQLSFSLTLALAWFSQMQIKNKPLFKDC